MQNVVSLAAAVAASSLLAVQAALVGFRARSCVRRSVPLLLAVFLLLAALKPLFPPASAAGEIELFAAAWAAGAFLIRCRRGRGFGAWTGGSLAAAFTVLIVHALGREETLPFVLLKAFFVTGLASVPLGHTLAMRTRPPSTASLMTFAAGCVWLAAGGAGMVWDLSGSPLVSALPPLFLCLCTGWMVFQEGYPERAAWGGSLPSLRARQPQEPAMYSRLLAAENALAEQERAIAAGFLALGAAHEFKNTISLVKLAAHHGLGRPDAETKDRCLRQIVEHTTTARDSAIDVLDRISSTREETPCILDARRDLAAALRRAGIALRGEGIVVELKLDEGVTFRARRSDVEQIVLSLIHNAAESYLKNPSEDVRSISVSASADEESAIVEVRDLAGGVPTDLRYKLFSPAVSGSGSTGLGLYLSRNLARANGGNVDYLPLAGGSSFRLTLPLAAGQDVPGRVPNGGAPPAPT
jgi:signal transduction histidine kinase